MRVAAVTLIAVSIALAGSSARAGTRTLTPTTTLAAETGNNTSAAGTFATQSNGNIAPGNVSRVPMSTLLYAGSTARVYAHFMAWFGQSNHMNVGYKSADPAQVHRQVADMMSRGITGAIVDWYGPNNTVPNQTTKLLRTEAEAWGGQFLFAVTEDGGALRACAATAGCSLTQQMISDLTYAYNNFQVSPAYLYVDGRPVVFFFSVDNYSIDWNAVAAAVPGNPLFIFRNNGAFTHALTSGGFSWVGIGSDPNSMGLGYLDSFYNTALTYPSLLTFGSAYPGFNDTLASWGANRIVRQQCGQTWLATLAEIGRYYNSTRQIPFVQLVTWNDYEEGTEIETGIDNCLALAASVTGTTLNWTISGQESTLDHFTVFASLDGESLMPLADVPAAARSFDLGGLAPGAYLAYVKAVGKPSIVNRMSAAVSFSITNQPPLAQLALDPLSGTAPLTVSASTGASSDPDGAIASSSIDFGDGTVMPGPSATHAYTVPGAYTVTATVTDDLGSTAIATATVKLAGEAPVARLAVTPAAGVAPVSVTASTGASTSLYGAITSSVIDFGDGAAASGPTATHSYTAPGTYTVTATVADKYGSSTATATVTAAANQPPLAALSLSATSAVAPATLTITTAASSDPDGTIASSLIDFGDGTTATGPAASHLYPSPGTYLVKATVTDNLGLSSSATQALTVTPAGVTMTAPVQGGSYSSAVRVVAGAQSGRGIIAMAVYVDYKLQLKVSAPSIDTTVALPTGQHRVVAQAWDSGGFVYQSTAFVDVTNQPPAAALAVTPSSGRAPLSVSASTAGSSDPDGSLASSTLDFGDGAVLPGPAAAHIYSVPGVYNLTATVTDNVGGVSQARQAVVAAGVRILAPAPGATVTSPVQFVAGAYAAAPITAIRIYVDNVAVYTASSASLNTSVTLSRGSHYCVVQAWDAAGAVYKTPVTINVQ